MRPSPRQAPLGFEPSSPGSEPSTIPGLCPGLHGPPLFAVRTESHFNNVENALWKNSCNDAVGAWLTLGSDMSAKQGLKTCSKHTRDLSTP